jgi:protein-S-isoprenylcysteine O-methyltransferase Ste14
VSAPAPALVNTQSRRLAMRLADPAATLAYVSLVFGSLLVFFPVSFPRLVVQNWQNARLTPIMIFFTVCLNLGLYLRVAHQRFGKPGIVASACLGSVPVILLAGLNFVLQATIAHTISVNAPNAVARVNEEILAHTFFALIAAIFGPFLLIRLAQQLRKENS